MEQRYGASADLGNIQNPGAIGQALSASRVHSLVTINATWITPAGDWAIANAVGEVSAAKMGNYLSYVMTSNVTHATTGSSGLPTVEARVIRSAAVERV